MGKAPASRRATSEKTQRTWVVVADGGHARVLESSHLHSGVTMRLDLVSDATQTAGRLAPDRLPRTQESGNAARHGIEPRLSLKDYEKRVFAARLAAYLKGGLSSFDRLILVAPMRFLNVLKEAMPEVVARKISATRRKDLTWMTDAQVLEQLGSLGRQLRRAREGA
ncbi:MAG TPA: host attachment protein [Dongiaceae bacterium]|nr:host attachment protein [Dongiaceae bacterium]